MYKRNKNFWHKNSTSHRFDSSKFLWLYGKGDLFESKELLCVSRRSFSYTATTIDQAKGMLRADIRSKGGNAAISLYISRGETSRTFFGNGYLPAEYTASAKAALVVPKNLPQEKKDELKQKFESLDLPAPRKESDEPLSCTTLFCALGCCCLFVLGAAAMS